MADVKIFIYQVEGHYSPPLPEDSFQRLEDDGFSSKYRTMNQMEAEEALVGLRLLNEGVRVHVRVCFCVRVHVCG